MRENSWLDMGICSPFCMAMWSNSPLMGNVTSGRLPLGRGHVSSSNSPWIVCHGGDGDTPERKAISVMLCASAISRVGFRE
jgi:hypothetical protein